MSRIGNKSIPVPAGVEVKIAAETITVKGSKGTLEFSWKKDFVSVSFDAEAKLIVVDRKDDTRQSKAMHGLTRSLINNMVLGTSTGWNKQLEIRGTGYRGQIQGKVLTLNLGYSHQINYEIPEGLTITMPSNTQINIDGACRQLVGQAAADIRFYRKPEVYKGKGIRYVGEHVALKEGKSAGKK